LEEARNLAAEELVRGRAVFMLAAPGFDTSALASRLSAKSVNCRMAVLEDLGYPEERIAVGTVSDPPVPLSRMFSLFLREW
jgi:cobalt-precorrin-7 (C5)-methyltransferase